MNKKAKMTVMSCALAGVLVIGGISAYFTDGDTATNTFTVGSVKIDLQEPNFSEDYPEITPGQEIKKDPKIVNTGDNDAYMFMVAKVPYKSVITASETGVAQTTASYQEIFTYDINAEWAELDGYKVIVDANDNVVEEANLVDGTEYFVKHVYAYGTTSALTAVAGEEGGVKAETKALFDNIKLVNLVEGNLEDTTLNVIIDAYAIQTANLGDAVDTADETIDGVNNTTNVPSEVWDIIVNAKVGTTPTQGSVVEDEATDIIR